MITGIMPKILSDKLKPNDVYVVSKGTDIDITIDDGNSETTLSAITLGNGKWEISELDDNSALFREYNEGDVISLDTLTKILKPLVSSKENDCCGNQIFSFNLLGKIKYGLQDKGREIERKKQERKDRFSKKVKGITDWFTDDIDKETATSFLRKSYPGAKVGKLEKYNDIDGANFKVLFGVPSEKKFYVGVLHRNGNDIRLLDDSYDAETPLRSFKDQDKCLEFYENYPYGKKEDDRSEQQENNTESNVADDFEGGSDYMKGETGESDGVEWEVVASLKKKKSKYNGKNVTGYEDGMLGEMAVASSRHLFSRTLLKSSFEIKILDFISSALNTAELKTSGDTSVVADKLKPALKQVKEEYADEARRIAAMWTRAKTADEFINIMKKPTVDGIVRKGFVKLCCDNPKFMQKLIQFLSKIDPK